MELRLTDAELESVLCILEQYVEEAEARAEQIALDEYGLDNHGDAVAMREAILEADVDYVYAERIIARMR